MVSIRKLNGLVDDMLLHVFMEALGRELVLAAAGDRADDFGVRKNLRIAFHTSG